MDNQNLSRKSRTSFTRSLHWTMRTLKNLPTVSRALSSPSGRKKRARPMRKQTSVRMRSKADASRRGTVALSAEKAKNRFVESLWERASAFATSAYIYATNYCRNPSRMKNPLRNRLRKPKSTGRNARKRRQHKIPFAYPVATVTAWNPSASFGAERTRKREQKYVKALRKARFRRETRFAEGLFCLKTGI